MGGFYNKGNFYGHASVARDIVPLSSQRRRHWMDVDATSSATSHVPVKCLSCVYMSFLVVTCIHVPYVILLFYKFLVNIVHVLYHVLFVSLLSLTPCTLLCLSNKDLKYWNTSATYFMNSNDLFNYWSHIYCQNDMLY